jgi:hypothetical protein
MEPNGEKRRRAPGEIIAGVVDELIIGGNVDSIGDAEFVIGFENALAAIG